MLGQALGFDPTQVIAATGIGEFPLGTVGEDQNGKRYVYCRANGALTAKTAVSIDINYDAAPSGNAGKVDGVVNTAVADNEYCWVQTSGRCTNVNVKDGLTAGMWLAVITDANGDLLEISATSATTGAHAIRAKLLENVAAGVADIHLYPTF